MQKIFIEQLDRRNYRVYHNGQVLMASTPSPWVASAKMLFAQGYTGLLTMYRNRDGKAYPCLSGLIEKCAKIEANDAES